MLQQYGQVHKIHLRHVSWIKALFPRAARKQRPGSLGSLTLSTATMTSLCFPASYSYTTFIQFTQTRYIPGKKMQIQPLAVMNICSKNTNVLTHNGNMLTVKNLRVCYCLLIILFIIIKYGRVYKIYLNKAVKNWWTWNCYCFFMKYDTAYLEIENALV